MTKADPPRGPSFSTLCLFVLVCLFAAGCDKEVDAFPEPGGVNESAQVLRTSPAGPIIVTYSPYPIRADAPSDGVRRALDAALGRINCSAASFYWSERAMAERWIKEQIDLRRQNGQPIRLILAGHSLGATEAAETARDILFRERDVVIAMLLTVDAVKTSRLGSPAAAAGAVVVNRLPGISTSLTAYEAAPAADGVTLWAHINYYHSNSVYHGTSMPGAENHLLDDWSGYLNHGNIDDFAYPLLVTDFKAALTRVGR